LLSRRRGAALLEAEAEENLVNDFEVEEEGEVGEGAKPAELKEETIGEVWGIGSEREGERRRLGRCWRRGRRRFVKGGEQGEERKRRFGRERGGGGSGQRSKGGGWWLLRFV
jgi:hypothetical protein